MPLTAEIAPEVVAACQQNAGEVAEALSRALDAKLQISVENFSPLSATQFPDSWKGPGLIILLQVDEQAAVLVLPEQSGLVPAWCRAPDTTGTSKLTTLAQELGMTLLPEAYMPVDFKAGYVADVSQALTASGFAEPGAMIPLQCSTEGKSATFSLVWPIAHAEELFKNPAVTAVAPEAKTKPVAAAESKAKESSAEDFEEQLTKLPTYVRSLLSIRVSVSVKLAATKQSVNKILNIGPGSIIQFDTHCEKPLLLCVGEREIAEGEAVKVGDKFGIRITSMVMPGERFFPIHYARRAS